MTALRHHPTPSSRPTTIRMACYPTLKKKNLELMLPLHVNTLYTACLHGLLRLAASLSQCQQVSQFHHIVPIQAISSTSYLFKSWPFPRGTDGSLVFFFLGATRNRKCVCSRIHAPHEPQFQERLAWWLASIEIPSSPPTLGNKTLQANDMKRMIALRSRVKLRRALLPLWLSLPMPSRISSPLLLAFMPMSWISQGR